MKVLSTHAHAAKLIRQELKQQFSTTKFSVISKSYSGGNSIDVDWVDGPTAEAVKMIIDKYESGHFNSMEDVPQVKFVLIHRRISDESYTKAFHVAKTNFADFKDIQTLGLSVKVGGMYINGYQSLNRIFLKMDLTKGFNFETFEKLAFQMKISD